MAEVIRASHIASLRFPPYSECNRVHWRSCAQRLLSRSTAKNVDIARAKIRAFPEFPHFLDTTPVTTSFSGYSDPMSWSIKSNILLYRAKVKARTERLRDQGSKLVFVLMYSAHAKCLFFPLAWGVQTMFCKIPYFPWSLFELL